MSKCDFVDPNYNFPCNKKAHTKIVINIPNKKEPIVKFACERHGDERFNYLSSTENRLLKEKQQNKIQYPEFSEKIKIVRWKECRRCNDMFSDTEIQCCLEYYFMGDIKISMRRSFLLHDDCLMRELKFYDIQKESTHKIMTLDGLTI